MTYYDPRKPKPWPIATLNKLGVRDDATATRIVIAAIVTIFVVTIFMAIDLTSESEEIQTKEIDPWLVEEMNVRI